MRRRPLVLSQYPLWYKFEAKNAQPTIEQMLSVIQSRGPDGNGLWTDGNKIGLGFVRLAIHDLSDNVNQPIENEDGSLVMVCNGEIYNFEYLTKLMIKKGIDSAVRLTSK